jgi:peptide/nickel transport system ATP-binding protein
VPDPPGVIIGGSIRVADKSILEMTVSQMEKIRGKDVSMIFQDPMTSLNPVFTVGEQIAESVLLHEKLTKTEAYEKAEELLEMVGIPKFRSIEYPHQFSGGMKQRVVIAIALACNPKFLIADEPTTALDVTIQAQVLELMKRLKDTYGTAMILITHDLGIVAEICDEVAVMYAGRIIEKGTLEEVFNKTRHPYTEGLFNSLPNIHKRNEELVPIPGLMPDPTNLPKGCAFAPRCSYASAACEESQPEPRPFSQTHSARCRAYEDPGFEIRRWRHV